MILSLDGEAQCLSALLGQSLAPTSATERGGVRRSTPDYGERAFCGRVIGTSFAVRAVMEQERPRVSALGSFRLSR